MILGVIPARGGSKGVLRKNCRTIAGKPLIVWTIEAAKRAKLIDRLIVSTEDPEIARIAEENEVEVLVRPKNLAEDYTTTLAVIEDILTKIDATEVVLLQPTSPVRDPGLIDDCIFRFMRGKADSLATGFICKYKEYGSNNLPRQKLDGFFYDDGNVYVIRSDLIKKGDRFGHKRELYEISREQNLEIDDELDFWLIEQLLQKRIEEGRQ